MNVQQLLPQGQQPKRFFALWIRIGQGITLLLAGLWHLIFWIWSILIAGAIAGILGNAAFTYFTTGSTNFKDPRTLTVITWLNAHIVLCILIVIPILILTLCSFLAHARQKHVTQKHQHLHDETLVVIGKGVQRALDELTAKSVVPLTPSDADETSSPKKVWNIPYARNPFFTGRENLIKQLHTNLTVNKATALTQAQAISGLGGIGKTQTAVEYAYRYRNDYQFVLWARAATRDILLGDYVALASLLNLPEKQEKDQNLVVAALKRWLITHEQWLLILDNADDLSMVYDFLPVGGTGHLLLTTRAQTAGSIAASIEVDKMDKEEGMLLLLRRSKVLATDASLAQASQEDRSATQAIVEQMDGLPLALDQAGAYMDETKCGISTYLALYQTRRKELIRWQSHFTPNYPTTVATTWAISFQKVKEASAVAAELLRLCAFLAPDAIPEELITEGASQLGKVLSPAAADPFIFNDALEVLGRYSLLRRNSTMKTLSIHRLVQAVLRDSMNNKTQHQWAERTVRMVNQAFPEVSVETWTQCQRFLPQAQACANLIDEYVLMMRQSARLLNMAAYYLHDHAQYTEAELLYQRALMICEKVFGPEDSATATTLNNLAELYYQQGKYEQAEPLYQQALTIREKVFGPEDPEGDTAQSLNGLALLYYTQGKYEQAEPLLQRALAISEQQLGSDHPDTAGSLNNLAGLYYTQGKYEQAEPLLQRALAIHEQQLGSDHPDTALSLNNLAGLYQAQGKYEQAEPLYQRALAIYEQQLGSDHPDTARSLNNLALLYYTQGKYEQAEPLYQRALAIYEQQLGSDHPNTITIRENYTTLLRQKKQK